MVDPSEVFNAATLDVVISARPSLVSGAPPPSSLSSPSLSDAALTLETDTWVQRLVTRPRRTCLYTDQPLSFYLVVTLPPSSNLTRPQAAALLLDSLPSGPHLALSADIALVPHHPSRDPPAPQPAPPPLPARTSSLGIHPTPVAPRAPDRTPTTHLETVHWPAPGEGAGSRVWVARGSQDGEWLGVWQLACHVPAPRTQLADPRLALALALTVTVTLRDDPRLGALIDRVGEGNGALVERGSEGGAADEPGSEDEEYMQDSYEDVNLLSSLSPIASTPLVLPFSRLASFSPAPAPSSGGAPARPHSLSISQHTRTLSSGTLASPHDPSATPPHPHPSHPHPSLRRSIRRTLPLVRAAHVDLRASPCPVGALGRAGGARGAGDEGEEEGWVLCLAVRGGAGVREEGEEREGERAFEVERVEVLLEGAAAPPTSSATATASATAPHDLELRPVAPPGPTPTARGGALVRLRAGSPAQHNLLYALCRAPDGLAGRGAATTPAPAPSVPRTVLQSPSMALRGGGRFGGGAGGFGAAGAEEGEGEGGEGGGAGEEGGGMGRGQSGERKVEVVLWGREVLLRLRGRRRGGLEEGPVQGYDVPAADGPGAPDDARPKPAEGKNDDADDADDDTDTGTDVVEPLTDLFASRFHTTLDLSTLLSPRTTTTPHTRHAAFAPPSPSTPSRARPSSLGHPSFLPSAPPLRPAPPAASSSLALSLSVAGSKRHTRAALAAASAPGLGRSTATMGGFAPQQQQRRESRALPETPQSPVVVPPPPRPASGGTGFQRASLPVPDAAPGAGAGARPKEGRRTSWMSGLVPGAGAGAGAGGATGGGGAGADRTSWPAGAAPPDSAPAPVATLGLGLDDPALAPRATSAAPGRPAGRLTISVSLVPLRAAKSRHRVPFAGAVAAGTATATATAMGGAADTGRTNAALPPPVLPGLAISRAPSPAPAAAAESQGTPRFAFPPSPSPSPSTTPLPSPPLPRAPARAAADRAAAQRTALATSRMPRVNLLDVFLVEVFVLNHSDQVRRLTVGVPARAVGSGAGAGRMTGTSVGQADDGEADAARLVPLENDVRIGPLAPNSCASVGIRFLAIRPGPHVVDALRVVDVADGSETRLERPLWVVVE